MSNSKMKVRKNNIFFTSDTHWFHPAILPLTNRPFKDSQEMTDSLIRNWNSVVPPDGTVFHLGDFAMTGNIGSVKAILDKLNGDKILIFGNHDIQNKFERDAIKNLFADTFYYLDLHVEDEEMEGGEQRLFLCHYPMSSWAGKQRGSWNLFGHIHSRYDDPKNALYNPAGYDVGVDANNYTPVSYDHICKVITDKLLHQDEKIIVEMRGCEAYCNDKRVRIIKDE